MFSKYTRRFFHFNIKSSSNNVPLSQIIAESPEVLAKNFGGLANLKFQENDMQNPMIGRIMQFYPQDQSKILTTLSTVGSIYEKSNNALLSNELNDIQDYNLETLTTICKEEDLQWLMEQGSSKPDFGKLLVKSVLPRRDISSSAKCDMIKKYAQVVDRNDFEMLIDSIQRENSENFPSKEKANLMLSAYRIFFNLPSTLVDCKAHLTSLIENWLQFDIAKPDPVYDPMNPTDTSGFVPTAATIAKLVFSLKKDFPCEALIIFYTHFFNVPNYEKKLAGPLLLENIMLLNRHWCKDTKANRKLFLRYMDERNINNERYISPTETCVRIIGEGFDKLTSLILLWKYEHVLESQKSIDLLSIERKKLGHENKLEAVWKLVQEPFSPINAYKLKRQWKEEALNDLKARQERNKELREKKVSANSEEEDE